MATSGDVRGRRRAPVRRAVPLVMLVALVWGVSVVADSAQFSSAVSELAPPGHGRFGAVGPDRASGFTLTSVTILGVGLLDPTDADGWRLAWIVLALGPVVGIVAMSGCAAGRTRRRWRTATVIVPGYEPASPRPRRLLDVPRRPLGAGRAEHRGPAAPPRAGPDPAGPVAVRVGLARARRPGRGRRAARARARRPASGRTTSRRSTTSTS